MLGIVVEEITATRVTCRMLVTEHHLQPFGIVHGGVYAAIAEAIASIGASVNASSKVPGSAVVGLDNHTTFIRATRIGTEIHAEADPRQAGRRTQSWDVSMRDPDGREVACSGSASSSSPSPTSPTAPRRGPPVTHPRRRSERAPCGARPASVRRRGIETRKPLRSSASRRSTVGPIRRVRLRRSGRTGDTAQGAGY